jgi:hypothetical protein
MSNGLASCVLRYSNLFIFPISTWSKDELTQCPESDMRLCCVKNVEIKCVNFEPKADADFPSQCGC